MWFDSWSDIGRVLAVGAAAYVTLIAILRLSGKRTLAKLNAFDFVVTVAFGSTLATILLSSDVSWAEGSVALASLAVFQFVVASATRHLAWVRRAVTAQPTVLLRSGALQEDAMNRQRVAREEVCHAVRAAGVGDLSTVAAVVLETDGSFSVIRDSSLGDGSALEGVDGA